MARDYVTIREEQRDGQTIWTSTTVSHDRLKSAPAKVTRRQNRYSIMGAAWGAPIAAVEVQIDDGPWMAARLESHALHRKRSRGYAWRFWTFEWGTPASGEHMIRSRAFDVDRNVQRAPSNGEITRGSAFTDGPWGVLRETGATAVAGNDGIVTDAERLACACSVHALTAIWFSEIPTCTPLSHRMI